MQCTPAELLKHRGEEINKIHKLVGTKWKKGKIPEWKLSTMCPIHKKGDKLNCQNDKHILLLYTAYKNFTFILMNKLEPCAEKGIEYQAGFRPG
jgi:hypothetical protein